MRVHLFVCLLFAGAYLLMQTDAAVAAPAMPFRYEASPKPADAPAEYPLYPDGASGMTNDSQAETWARLVSPDGSQGSVVRNVTRPSYSVFLPDPAHATGAAVILAPGGAFLSLSMTSEGWAAARWLANHGVAAFVLKYRTNPTPAAEGAFMAEVAQTFSRSGGLRPDQTSPVTDPFAVPDGQAMVRLLRHDAARFHIDPHRVGFVGFSAGAITALGVVLADEPASRPDFVGLIYPPMNREPVPSDAPEAFVRWQATMASSGVRDSA